ncbi:MAG: exo-alpha-sialidase [Planctomycetes bacterium]|nr:exo-alpha-sialidase [Planctomycetota bacterium]
MEAYLKPPEKTGPPDEEYDKTRRQFQGIPGIECSRSGRLWATWYGGGTGEDHHNYVLLATRKTEGAGQFDTKLIVDPDGDGPVRAFDPCLWHDPEGKLWLFWAQGYEGHTDERSGVWAIKTDKSDDEDPQWSEPQRLCDGIMMNKPLVLSSGDWLLPTARWHQDGSAQVHASTNKGKSWDLRGKANVPSEADRNCDEHMVVERKNGDLWMLVRTSYGIGESVSHDRGRFWSPVEPSGIEHPTSRFFVRRMESGNLLLCKHGPIDCRTGRSHLMAFLSDNEGQSWEGGLMLDERDGVSYPDGAQRDDSLIYIIYDRDRRGAEEILMAQFREEDILREKLSSDDSRLRIVVNKAGG